MKIAQKILLVGSIALSGLAANQDAQAQTIKDTKSIAPNLMTALMTQFQDSTTILVTQSDILDPETRHTKIVMGGKTSDGSMMVVSVLDYNDNKKGEVNEVMSVAKYQEQDKGFASVSFNRDSTGALQKKFAWMKRGSKEVFKEVESDLFNNPFDAINVLTEIMRLTP